MLKEAAAEFLGTFVLIVFGLGVVAQTVLSKSANGSYLGINLGWGLAVMLGVYTAGGVSGAHLNPAVSIALAVRRGFPWPKVPAYVAAQIAGAFVGGMRQVQGAMGTAGIFATYPQPFLSTLGGLIDQLVGTALLMACVLAITDQRNAGPPSWLAAPLIGLLVVAIGVAFGFNAGYAINPARDFGPRLFTAIAGWGGEVFSAGNGWWWVPIAGPIAGALTGAVVYDSFVGRYLPNRGVEL